MFQRQPIDRGAILFDPERVDRPGWELFDRDRWRARGALIAHTGGRGSIHFIEDGGRHWALRRYLRGGMAARIAHERFLYSGEERTRSFLELRLLAKLRDLDLPVPAPVAAGYRRSGCAYEAELVTERLMGATTLIEMLRAGRMSDARWAAIGACLRRFHDAGVQHADLNAQNIMLGEQGETFDLQKSLVLTENGMAVPPVSGQLSLTGALFLAISWYFFYMISQALENYWGVFRFNLFLFLGWAMTVGVAFLFPANYATNLFLAGSVFLAFAFLNPDFELLIFFILPVKIKWLALIQWIFYGYALLAGTWPVRLSVLASISNFLIFFTGDIIQRLKTGRRRMEHQARQTAARDNDEPRHTCVACGKTDRSHPREDFRYSEDDKCYCSEHRPGAAKKA